MKRIRSVFASLKYWVVGIYFLSGLLGLAAARSVNSGVTLAWNPSVTPGVAGYWVYYGTASHQYTHRVSAGKVTTRSLSRFQPGITYYFAVTAYNASGDESDFSNEAAYTCPIVTSAAGTLIPANDFGKQIRLTVGGRARAKYILVASTNLVEWFAVSTNRVPFSYEETNTGEPGARFFRAVRQF
ncbi:MAG TPA: fibronectin type III domain-containing protein [Verrucomicrobiae bacterium]|nr:fibronectin type III domain-containing protein [Verrucomicrobiae bacterium]